MRLLTHIVSPEQEGWPLRRLLRQEQRISGSFLSRLKWRPGAILVNGRPVTVAGAVCHYLGQGSFHCVNRLDRGTTGVMVVAKTGYVHRLCMEQLHSGDFRRTYLAVCSGVPSPAAGSIDLPIGREPDSLLRRRVDPAGLAAHTDYETLWQGPDRALLRLTPGTGRTHQLRLHLSAIGHPLLGDWLYGTEDRTLIPRPALHSHRLELTHPVTRRRLTVTAPLPEDMARLLPEDMNKS